MAFALTTLAIPAVVVSAFRMMMQIGIFSTVFPLLIMPPTHVIFQDCESFFTLCHHQTTISAASSVQVLLANVHLTLIILICLNVLL